MGGAGRPGRCGRRSDGKIQASVVEVDEAQVTAMITQTRQEAEASQEPRATDFLDPEYRPLAQSLLAGATGLLYRWEGGYAGASRCRLHIYPDYLPEEELPPVLAALEATVGDAWRHDLPAGGGAEDVAGRPTAEAWRGGLLKAGVCEGKIGDLLLLNGGLTCQVVVVPDIVEQLRERWRRAGPFEVEVHPIDVEALSPPNQRRKEMRVSVASLRLDAVAALGFGHSRNRAVRDIRTARVKLNWVVEEDPAHPVRVGDVISIRGRGRVVVEGIEGASKKGRTVLRLVRFL